MRKNSSLTFIENALAFRQVFFAFFLEKYSLNILFRYYLSAAGNVLDRLERDMVDHPDLAKAQAELARGWIYYALRLFDASKAKDIDRICTEIFQDESSSSGWPPIIVPSTKWGKSIFIIYMKRSNSFRFVRRTKTTS